MTTFSDEDHERARQSGKELMARLAAQSQQPVAAEPVTQHPQTGRKVLSQVAWLAGLWGSRSVWHAVGGGGWGVVAVIATILTGFILAGKLWPTAK